MKLSTKHAQSKNQAINKQLVLLTLLTMMFFVSFMSRIIFSPLMLSVKNEFLIDKKIIGQLFLFIASGYAITLFSTGFIASKVTYKKQIFFSAILIGFVLMGLANCSQLIVFKMLLFLLGLVSGVYLPSAIMILSAELKQKHLGKAFAVHEFAPNMAYISAPLIYNFFIREYKWNHILMLVGSAAFIIGGLFYCFADGGDYKAIEKPNLQTYKNIISKGIFWKIMLIFGVGIGGTVGLYNILPIYLTSGVGIEKNLANNILSISKIFSISAIILGGFITDYFGAKRTAIVALILSGIFIILLNIFPSSTKLILYSQSMIAGFFFPAGYALLSYYFKKELRSIAVSLILPFAFILGAGIVPAVIGYMAETYSFSTGIIIVGIATILSGGIFILPEKNITHST